MWILSTRVCCDQPGFTLIKVYFFFFCSSYVIQKTPIRRLCLMYDHKFTACVYCDAHQQICRNTSTLTAFHLLPWLITRLRSGGVLAEATLKHGVQLRLWRHRWRENYCCPASPHRWHSPVEVACTIISTHYFPLFFRWWAIIRVPSCNCEYRKKNAFSSRSVTQCRCDVSHRYEKAV